MQVRLTIDIYTFWVFSKPAVMWLATLVEAYIYSVSNTQNIFYY